MYTASALVCFMMCVLGNPALATEPTPLDAIAKAETYATAIYKKPTWRVVVTRGSANSTGNQTVATSRMDGTSRLIRLDQDFGTLRELSLIRGEDRWLIEPERSVLLKHEPFTTYNHKIDPNLLSPHAPIPELCTWKIRAGTWRNQATWQVEQAYPDRNKPIDPSSNSISILRYHLRATDYALLAREDFTRDGRLVRFDRVDVVDHPADPDPKQFALPADRPQITVMTLDAYLTVLGGGTP